MNRRRPAIGAAPDAPAQRPAESLLRRVRRHIVQRVAILLALLILFYSTSLHGIGTRTFLLAGILILFLYWLFKDML